MVCYPSSPIHTIDNGEGRDWVITVKTFPQKSAERDILNHRELWHLANPTQQVF